jgi:predicted acyltransferase
MKPQLQRYNSVDVLRGLTVAAMLLVNNPGDWGHVFAPLLHAEWHGCTPTDLIFPFFLFVVGVSIALSIVPRLENGADAAWLRKDILIRGAKIIALGLLLNLLSYYCFHKDWYRPWGVLQRIGVCFIAAGWLVTVTKARAQWLWVAALLLGYWALLAWGGSYERYFNLTNRVDVALLGHLVYKFDVSTGLGYDPEGLLSTLPAIATVLLGVRAGTWLRRGAVWKLLPACALALLIGYLWSFAFPFNKNLWTSSFVLWTAGWAMLALVLCHLLADRWRWPLPGRRFGVNAIAAFVGSDVMLCLLVLLGWLKPIYNIGFVSWITPNFGPYVASLAFAIVFVLFWWLVMWWMDRRGWHLKL